MPITTHTHSAPRKTPTHFASLAAALQTGFRPAPTQPGLSEADRRAHEAASYVRRPQPTAAASEEHGKTKEPLPPRPRGPHPYPTPSIMQAGT